MGRMEWGLYVVVDMSSLHVLALEKNNGTIMKVVEGPSH